MSLNTFILINIYFVNFFCYFMYIFLFTLSKFLYASSIFISQLIDHNNIGINIRIVTAAEAKTPKNSHNIKYENNNNNNKVKFTAVISANNTPTEWELASAFYYFSF